MRESVAPEAPEACPVILPQLNQYIFDDSLKLKQFGSLELISIYDTNYDNITTCIHLKVH